MAAYDVHISEADRFRIDNTDYVSAITRYKLALAVGGKKDRYIRQMIGVCYNLIGEPQTAIEWLEAAAVDANAIEAGSIYRDLAACYQALRDYGMAHWLLIQSLDFFSPREFSVQRAVTLGFLGRLEIAQGDVAHGLGTLTTADSILRQGNNRHVELYNKLHLVDALYRNRQWIQARMMAWQSLQLARSHGAPDHRMRALALLVFGPWAYQPAKRLRHRCGRLQYHIAHKLHRA